MKNRFISFMTLFRAIVPKTLNRNLGREGKRESEREGESIVLVSVKHTFSLCVTLVYCEL